MDLNHLVDLGAGKRLTLYSLSFAVAVINCIYVQGSPVIFNGFTTKR